MLFVKKFTNYCFVSLLFCFVLFFFCIFLANISVNFYVMIEELYIFQPPATLTLFAFDLHLFVYLCSHNRRSPYTGNSLLRLLL